MSLTYRILTTIACLLIGVIGMAVDLSVGFLTGIKTGVLEIAKAIKETWL